MRLLCIYQVTCRRPCVISYLCIILFPETNIWLFILQIYLSDLLSSRNCRVDFCLPATVILVFLLPVTVTLVFLCPEPPLQPTADCPSHVPKVNRTKVVCTCQTEHIGQPAGLLEWRQGSVSIKRGRYGQSELTLTNADLAGGKNEYTCLLHWVNVSQVYVTIRVDGKCLV